MVVCNNEHNMLQRLFSELPLSIPTITYHPCIYTLTHMHTLLTIEWAGLAACSSDNTSRRWRIAQPLCHTPWLLIRRCSSANNTASSFLPCFITTWYYHGCIHTDRHRQTQTDTDRHRHTHAHEWLLPYKYHSKTVITNNCAKFNFTMLQWVSRNFHRTSNKLNFEDYIWSVNNAS